jgi:hypothetical protein
VKVHPVSNSYAIKCRFRAGVIARPRLVPKEKEIMIQSKQVEPPSRLKPPVLMVGQDGRGNWVVQDQSGARGGLFVSRDAALRYVRDENRDRQRSVVMISGILELDVNRRPLAAVARQSATDDQRPRRVA